MKIKFLGTNQEFTRQEKELPLIDLCYDEDTPVTFGCRIGMCGTCRITIAKGIENVSPKNEEEDLLTEEKNERLACQCSVKGDVEIE